MEARPFWCNVDLCEIWHKLAFRTFFHSLTLQRARTLARVPPMQLTDEQKEVRDCNGKTVVVAARAGSGKTATMVSRIQKQLAEGTPPDDVVAITYTVAGARELQHRLGVKLGYCGTLHGFAFREMGIDPATIATDEEVAELINEAVANLNIRGTTTRQVVRAMEDVIDPPGDLGVMVRRITFELTARGQTTFALVLRAFLRRVKCDLPTFRGFALLVVDEAQDTAPIDAAIYEAMAATQKVYIGDDLQAIFGFRGCDDRFFRRMARRADNFLTLSRTFRCRPRICEAANRLFPQATKMASVHEAMTGMVYAHRFPNEARELQEISDWAFDCQGTTAVLCRYNADVARVGAWLRMNGHKVRMKRTEVDKAVVATLRAIQNPTTGNVADYLHQLGARATFNIQNGATQFYKLRETPDPEKFTIQLMLIRAGIPEAVAREAAPPGCSLAEALEAATRAESPDKGDVEENTVWVGTIHGAKGREFDDVLVASCYAPGKTADRDEEARIFYVAITRARNSATLTLSQFRDDARTGELTKPEPSPFIAEAGIQLIEK